MNYDKMQKKSQFYKRPTDLRYDLIFLFGIGHRKYYGEDANDTRNGNDDINDAFHARYTNSSIDSPPTCIADTPF